MQSKKYIYNFFAVAGGTLIAQVITFIASPLLSRLYSPIAFGYFSTYSATVSILAVISCARYELAIPLPKDILKSVNIFKVAIIISTIISLLSIPIIIIIYLFSKRQFEISYLLYPIIILLNGLGLSLNLLHNKLSNFKHSSISKILQSLIVTFASIAFSNFFQTHGLIFGSFLGQIINILYLLLFLPPDIKSSIFNFKLKIYQFYQVLYIHKSLPKVSLFPAFLNIFSSQMPNYLITVLYGAGFAGYYFFSLRLVVLPLTLVGSSINEIFYQKVIEKKNNKQQLKGFVLNNFLFLFLMGSIFLIAVFLFSQKLIPFFFGSHWQPSILVCKILAVSMFVKLIVSPLTMSFIALDNIRTSAMWQYFYFIGLILICTIIYFINCDFTTALVLIVGFDIVAYGIALGLINYNIRKFDLSIFK